MKNLIHNWNTDVQFRSDARRLAIVAIVWTAIAVVALATFRIGVIAVWAIFTN